MLAVARSLLCWFAWLGAVALLISAVGCTSEPLAAPPAPIPEAVFDVTPRPITVIPAGTVIGDGPPEGWTHLLVKSYPKAGAGDADQLSASMRELSDKFLSSMLAKVERDTNTNPSRYRLAEVATGVGTRIKGQDVIISKEKHDGANLGLMGGWALEKAYGRVEAAKIVLRSDTLAVYDAPMNMLRHGKHSPVMLRYVFLLDPANGRLESLQWFIDQEANGGSQEAVGPMELLRPSHIEDRIIHVDAEQMQLGFLTEQALALTHIYHGRKQYPFPDGFQGLAGLKTFTLEAAAQFDGALRRLVLVEDP